MRAILIPANNSTPYEVHVTGYEEIKAAIGGGMLEILSPFPRPDLTCYLDEEGKLKSLRVNRIATMMTEAALMPGDMIAGDMLLIGFDPDTGEEIDLPEEFSPTRLPVAIKEPA